MAIFDPESQVLFSGDLFGGLNQPGRVQLYGEEADWPGIAQFHRIYMPCTAALDYAIRQIRALKPAVKIIAPQHGFVLQGDFMETVLERLQTLPVGMDSLASELDEKYLEKYQEVLDELLQTAAQHFGRQELISKLAAMPEDHELRHYLHMSQSTATLTSHGIRALPLIVDELGSEEFDAFRSLLKARRTAKLHRSQPARAAFGLWRRRGYERRRRRVTRRVTCSARGLPADESVPAASRASINSTISFRRGC